VNTTPSSLKATRKPPRQATNPSQDQSTQIG